MQTYTLIEDGKLSGVRKTADGYLAAQVRCARIGIQDYSGAELGIPERSNVRVLRPEDEVFSKASMQSYAGKPATNDHPRVPVTADNWKQHSVGGVAFEVARDGDYVSVPLLLMDSAAISDVEAGKREISMGYAMDLDMTPGKTADGQAYDAVMRNLKMNHLAIVDKGRAGPIVRIGDHWGSAPTNDGKPTMTTRTVILDGLSVETTDAGAQAIEKLQGDVAAVKAVATSDAKAAQDKLDAKDRELAAKDTEITELKGKVLDAAALDKLVADRAALTAKAQSFAKDADFSGKSAEQIKAIAVDAAKGADFCKDKSAPYIDVAFDMLKAPSDPFRDAIKDRAPASQTDSNAQDEYEKRITDGWKEQQGAAA